MGRDLLTVVTFHRVLPEAALREYPLGQLAVSVDELSWFVQSFLRHYTCGSLAALHRRWLAGERPASPFLAITFDDGQLDNFEHARPVLDRLGVKASFFAPLDAIAGGELLWHDRLGYAARGLIGKGRRRAVELLGELGPAGGLEDQALLAATLGRAKRLTPAARLEFVARVEAALGNSARPAWDGPMSWEQLQDLVRGGHEVGSHSLSHAILTLVDDQQLEREVGGSKSLLEGRMGVPCESFCYPNGDCDDRVAEAVRRAGYLRAVTTAWGPNGPHADPRRLSRCDMHGRHSRTRFGQLSEARLAFRLSRYVPGPRA